MAVTKKANAPAKKRGRPRKDAAPSKPRGRPKKEAGLAYPEYVTQKDIAQFLGVAPSAINLLVKSGVLEKEDSGKLDFPKTIKAYFAHKGEKVAAKNSGNSSADRLRAKREEELTRKMAREDRELISMDEAQTTIDMIVGKFSEMLSGLPARLTKSVRERQRIEAVIDQESQRISDYFLKAARALEEGIDISEAEGETDT